MIINVTVLSKLVQNVSLFRFKYRHIATALHPDCKLPGGVQIPRQVLQYLETAGKIEHENTVLEEREHDNHYNSYSKDTSKLLIKKLHYLRGETISERIDPTELERSLSNIEVKYESIISQLTSSQVLECLIYWLKVDPEGISGRNVYAQSIDSLKTALKRNQLSHQEVVKLLFIASLRNSSKVADVEYIMKYIRPIDQLSLIEKAIVTNAFFRCSIKLKHEEVRVIEETIEENAPLLVTQQYGLVPLAKAVLYSGPSKNFTMKNLSRALINAKSKLDFQAISYIVSLYATAYSKNTHVLSRLFNDAFDHLTTGNKEVRFKNVERLIRAAGTLNYPLGINEIEIVNTLIDEKFDECKRNINGLVGTLIALWILGHKSDQIIKRCFAERIFEPIVEQKFWKHIYKLQLLLSCIRIEAPEIQIPDELYRPDQMSSKIKKNVRSMFNEMNQIKDDLRLSELEINCPIPGLTISGISAKYNKLTNVHIDFMDESMHFRNSDELNAWTILKVRLLSKSGYHSILIPREIMNDSKLLRSYLLTILN